MCLKRRFLLFAAFLFAGLSVAGLTGNSFAAEHSRAGSGKPSAPIIGTWHSAKGTLTFKANGTIIYKGKRYYYAVSNGGTIQLSGKHGSLTFPYQLSGGKLTLTVDGKGTVYTRKR
ncbi:MAG: hypothetical protein OEV15_08535 [Gallionella sp.]|nr:hypothetical protein [Gallionella sp.]